MNNPFWTAMLGGIKEEMEAKGMDVDSQLVTVDANSDQATMNNYVNDLIAQEVDAIILAPMDCTACLLYTSDMGMTYQAVLANDIRKRNHLSDLKITYVYHDQTYNLDNDTKVDTLLSNDSGVAFIVKTKEGTIYHAGDLNDWYWDGEPKPDNQRLTSAYRAEIRKIKGRHFDAAFVPLDPRQGDHYADGILYFLKNVDCNRCV